jgi:hypothetical protein
MNRAATYCCRSSVSSLALQASALQRQVADSISAKPVGIGALCSRIAVHNRALELRLRTEAQYREAAEAPKGATPLISSKGSKNCQKNLLSDSGRNALILNYVTKRS